MKDGDRLLVISEDDGSYQPGKSNAPKHPIVGLSNIKKPKKPVIKMLICGWRHDLKDVLRLIDSSVAKGDFLTPTLSFKMKEVSPYQEFSFRFKNWAHGQPVCSASG